MVKINANIAAMEEKIGRLKTLRTECEAIEATANTVVGSGMSIEVVQAVDVEYAQIKTAVLTLLDNSIAFFNNVKQSLVEADVKAAYKLN